MALDNFDFAITTLENSSRKNRQSKGDQRYDTESRSRQRVQQQNPIGRGTLAPPSLTPASSSRLDRLVLKVSAKDLRKMFQMINAGKRNGWTD